MVKKTYIINGMHCSACEINVERAVKKIKGIQSAKATLVDSKLIITAQSEKNLPTVHQINSTIKKYGYEIVPHGVKTKTKQKTFGDYFWVGIGITVFITIFLLAGDSAFISGVYVTPESNAVSFFVFGLAAGISSCAALVGGMILSVQNSWLSNKDGKPSNKYLPFIMFNGSRLVTYAVLGGLLGLIGRALKISIVGSAIITIVISVFMFVVGLQMVGIKWLKGIALNPFRRMFNHGLDESNKTSNLYPIAMGALTFFVPCGFTIIAQTQAIGSGSFWMGFVSLSAFAFGTLPVLTLISFSSIKLHSNPRFSSAFQLFSGILVIFFALFSINGQIEILGLPQLSSVFMPGGGNQSDTVVEAATEITEMPSTIASPQNFQIMTMEARGFEYFPKVITIKANMPTRFEITDSGSIGCARAVYPRGLYDQIILLQPGLNTVEFTSPESGSYQISCSMWMVDPITVIVE